MHLRANGRIRLREKETNVAALCERRSQRDVRIHLQALRQPLKRSAAVIDAALQRRASTLRWRGSPP